MPNASDLRHDRSRRTREETAARATGRRHAEPWRCVRGLPASGLAAAITAVTLCAAASAAPPVEEIVAGYNAGIRGAMDAVESLTVEQSMLEPVEGEEGNRARAVLTYSREGGMEREEIESSIGHPKGEYTLASLVGPELTENEYAVTLAGVEEKDGRDCYRLEVTSLERDFRHFDGAVWVTVDGFNLVRVTGSVADPPFPVVRVELDKAFEPGPCGLWLLRRHTGEVEVQLGFIKRRGMIHIFYDNYSVSIAPEARSE